MPDIDYVFEDDERTLHVVDGDPGKPLIVLLHGMGGDRTDWTSPSDNWPYNYDHSGPLPTDRDIGWRGYPGVGVWSFALDEKVPVTSWNEVLTANGFTTATYSQVDRSGLLDRPAQELAVVFQTLLKNYPNQEYVILAQSRGGLLARKFAKDRPDLTGNITTFITLHSPHEGSSLASLAVTLHDAIDALGDVFGDIARDALAWLTDLVDTPAYQELDVGGTFLADLRDGEKALPGVRYFTFGGTSVRLTRVISWVYTIGSALPRWHWPPFHHEITAIEVPIVSPLVDSLPNIAPELSEGSGDLLTADARTRLPFAEHRTNSLNHAESLWDPGLQAQVLSILGVETTFW